MRLRSWKAQDVLVLARALDVTVPWLMTPPPGEVIELPDGAPFDVKMLGDLSAVRDEARQELEEAQRELDGARQRARAAEVAYDRVAVTPPSGGCAATAGSTP